MSTANLVPASGPEAPIAFTRDNTAMRLGVALAASIGLNVLLVMGAGRLAESMELRAPSRDEVPISIAVVNNPAPVATPTPAAKPSTAPTPVAAAATPVPTPVAEATPRAVPTPRPERTTPTRPIRSSQRVRAQNQVTNAANTVTRNSAPDLPLLKRGNTTNPNPAQPAARAANNRIQASAVAAAAGSRQPGSAGAAVRPAAPVAAGLPNNNPAPLAVNPAAPEVKSTVTGNIRQLATNAGKIGRVSASNSVVTMNAKAAAALANSSNSFEVPTGGVLRTGTATARQGISTAAEVTGVSGTPDIISTTQEAEVLGAPGVNRRLVGVNSAAIRGPIGTTVTDLRARTGAAGTIEAGIGDSAGATGGSGTGASGGSARGVATRVGGAASGRDGELASVGGGGVGANSNGVGVGNGSGRGTAASGNGTGGVAGGAVRGTRGPAGGPGGGTRAGSGGGITGVPNGVEGGRVTSGGATVRGTGGTAKAQTGEGPGKIDSDKAVKAEAQPPKTEDKKLKDVTISDDASDVSVGNGATQVGARAVSKPSIDGYLTDEMRRAKINSGARFRVTVEASGRASVDLLDGTGNSDVDRALTSYLKAWRWEPAKQDGKPVKSSLTQRLALNQN